MLDLFLIVLVGFLGSFGHCAGMCGPLTVAFSLSQAQKPSSPWQPLYFHGLLNLGRILSYALVGAAIGAVSSVVLAGGSLAGVGSSVRQGFAILTGLMLIWFGLLQINPAFLPKLPVLHPLLQVNWHHRLSQAVMQLSTRTGWGIPALLGMVWGLFPCGFLYTAQLKAAETGNLWQGMATLLAFGVGTLPMMLGVGIFASKLSRDRRSQLYRLGGWVTLTIGCLTLLRTDAMVDFTGYGALTLLILALIARPIHSVWQGLLRYRRALGVGSFILAAAHTGHQLDHTLQWNLGAIEFMMPQHQLGIFAGAIALALLTPATLTSFDRAQRALGKHWRHLHLFSIPALLLTVIHTILIGSQYLGNLNFTGENWGRVVILALITSLVLLVRSRWIWKSLGLHKFYTPPNP